MYLIKFRDMLEYRGSISIRKVRTKGRTFTLPSEPERERGYDGQWNIVIADTFDHSARASSTLSTSLHFPPPLSPTNH